MKLGALYPNPLGAELADVPKMAEAGVAAIAARPEVFVDEGFSFRIDPAALGPSLTDSGVQLAAVWASKGVMDGGSPDAGVAHITSCIDLADALREFFSAEALPVVIADAGTGDKRADHDKLVEALKTLGGQAEGRQVILAMRPDRATMLDRSRNAVKLLSEVGATYIQAALDAAATVGDKDTLDKAIERLKDNIVLACARDVKFDESGNPSYLPAGKGMLNYQQYVELLAEAPGCAYLVATELVSEGDAKVALAKLKGLVG